MFLSRTGTLQVLTCAYLAIIGNHRAYAGAGLVASDVPRQLAGTPAWKNRATYPLIASTALAVTLWSLRFANVLGESPL